MVVAWEAIQKALDWLEDNLSETIDSQRLRDRAGLSEFYFQKLFARLVGKTVFEYVKLRRLEKAADMLRESRLRVADVAFEMGFENHETFTRAFKEKYGMTPKEYQRDARPLNHFYKPEQDRRELYGAVVSYRRNGRRGEG